MFSRRSMIFVSVAGAVSACVRSPRLPSAGANLSLAEVVSRHTAARGGAANLDAVHSYSAAVIITEKGAPLAARYACSDVPAWRIDIYVDAKHVFCEGMDAAGPWLWPGGASAPRDAVADARKTGIQGIEFNLYGLHRFPERGHQLTLDGRELIDGVNYYIVRVVMKDSYETFLYINPSTMMIERRRDFRAFHPDVDIKKAFAEKVYSDFRTVNGLVTPFFETQANWKTGELVNTTRVASLAYNAPLAPGALTRFYQPPEHW